MPERQALPRDQLLFQRAGGVDWLATLSIERDCRISLDPRLHPFSRTEPTPAFRWDHARPILSERYPLSIVHY